VTRRAPSDGPWGETIPENDWVKVVLDSFKPMRVMVWCCTLNLNSKLYSILSHVSCER